MTPGRCYVAPSERQQELLRCHASGNDMVILAGDIFENAPVGLDSVIRSLERAADAGLDVFCMSEAGVYLASITRTRLNVGFSQKALDANTKLAKQELLQSAGLPVMPTERYILGSQVGLPAKLPFVIKPDFGFASQLAMRITNLDDWNRFLAAANNPELWESRKVYADLLFAADESLLDRFVVQPDLSQSMFLTVSFVFVDGVATSFIASGEKTQASAATSFAWRGFAAPGALPHDAIRTIDLELGRMAQMANCRNGVYAAELLWTDSRHWYLEFEPRPQSGLVPDLLLYAFGVDIDEIAIALFHGNLVDMSCVERPSSPSHFGLRRDESHKHLGYGTLAMGVERSSAGTILRDEIWALPKEVG